MVIHLLLKKHYRFPSAHILSLFILVHNLSTSQEKHGTIVQGRPINIRHHNSSNNNARSNNVKAAKPTQSPTINSTSDLVSSPSVFSNSPNPASPTPQVIPASDVSALKPGAKPARFGDVPKETGEQPDDAALTNK